MEDQHGTPPPKRIAAEDLEADLARFMDSIDLRRPLPPPPPLDPPAAPPAADVVAEMGWSDPAAALSGVSEGPTLADVMNGIDARYAAAARAESPTVAAPRGVGEAAAMRERVILFALGTTTFAVAARNVREVDRAPEVTPVPGVPIWLNGVANLRGDLISVVDLRAFLGVEAAAPAGRMLVVASDTGEIVSAFLVDAVPGMALVASSDLMRPDAISDARIQPYIVGIVEHEGHLVTVLDAERILNAPAFLATFAGDVQATARA
jgi:purine-binding chemotaxis protein CheW